MFKTLRRKNTLLSVLLAVSFIAFIFYLGISLKKSKKTDAPAEEPVNAPYTPTDTKLIESVLEESLVDFFNESTPEYGIKSAKREISKEQISTLTSTYRYTLNEENLIQQKAVFISEVVKGNIYKFKFNYEGNEYTVDIDYSSVKKLSDADYGFDAQGMLLRSEFFPVDKENIKLLKSGAIVYLIFAENQLENSVIKPNEVVILSYE